MTVKKAIQLLDWWISQKQDIMEKLRKEWGYKTFEEATGTSKMLFEMDKIQIENLEKIRKELIPDCTHPKESHDIDGTGQKYCTGCNFDLD